MRNGSLDMMRLVAACGIVIFHAGGPGAAIGYAGLHFFLILLPLFAFDSGGRVRARTGRAERLLLPWLGWGLIFGALKLAEVVAMGKPWHVEFQLWMLVTGPALHLWFLPFAFVVTSVLPLLQPLSNAIAQRQGPALAVAAGLATLSGLSLGLLPMAGTTPPWPQYAFGIPGVLLGLAIGLSPGQRARWMVLATLIAGFHLAGWPQGALQLAIAGAAILACLQMPRTAGPLSRQAAGMALTVYLLHPLILSLAERAAHLSRGGAALTLTGLALTLGLAAALRTLAVRLPPTAQGRRFLGL